MVTVIGSGELRYFKDGKWRDVGFRAVEATGGTETDIAVDGVDYRLHTFSTSATFSVSRGGPVEFLIVAGGGSGGRAYAGGGGAGGVVFGVHTVDVDDYSIVVGAGAVAPTSNGQGNDGQNSTAFGYVATGGGGGGYFNGGAASAGRDGGCGGGGGPDSTLARAGGVSTQASYSGVFSLGTKGGDALLRNNNNRLRGAGGGGAGQAGLDLRLKGDGVASNGGAGFSSIITGAVVFYAGGGGGAGGLSTNVGQRGFGGVGGGGNGAEQGTQLVATSGTDGTGGGGGGSFDGSFTGGQVPGDGGDGIVIVRYRL